MPSLLFNPTPEAEAQILERFTCPVSSLSNIAADYDTTLDALCTWMATARIQEKLKNSESQAAERTRQCASHRMHFAVEALIEMLAGYTHSERKVPMTASLAHIECRERQRNNARRAAFLLHRLSRYHPQAFPAGFVLVREAPQATAAVPPNVGSATIGGVLSMQRSAQPVIDVPSLAPQVYGSRDLTYPGFAPASPEHMVLPVTSSLTAEPVQAPIARPGTSRLRVAVATDIQHLAPESPQRLTSDIVPTSHFSLGSRRVEDPPRRGDPLPTSNQFAPPTAPLEPDLHQQLIAHEPSPGDHGCEPDPFNHGPKPASPPRLTEVCATRSDISDLKSMSGPWAPRPRRSATPPRTKDSS